MKSANVNEFGNVNVDPSDAVNTTFTRPGACEYVVADTETDDVNPL
ncbi:hypothetical protein [Mesorhizobium japonicum]